MIKPETQTGKRYLYIAHFSRAFTLGKKYHFEDGRGGGGNNIIFVLLKIFRPDLISVH